MAIRRGASASAPVSMGVLSGAPSYKRAVPRVSEHVPRPGLAARLTDGVRRASLVWVVGLPGSGKTSLVARWIAESGRPYLWYRLDENDVDVASLFDAIAHSVSDSRRLPVWSPENQADLQSAHKAAANPYAGGESARGSEPHKTPPQAKAR